MIKLYLCRGMSHRIKEEVVLEAKYDKEFFEKAGFVVLDPVSKEQVKPTKEKLLSSRKAMLQYWPMDCEMIREAYIVLDMTPHLNSEGVKHEIGKARYHYWKPIVRVFPVGKLPPMSSVAHFEDDYICDSLIQAVEYIYRVHGTPLKRLKWKLSILNRCFIKFLYVRFMWFFDWI